MRFSYSTACASILIAGGLLAATAATAMAGANEAEENSFWTSQSNGSVASQATAATNGRTGEYKATYYTEEQLRVPKAAASASAPEKDPPEFYHAKGTMGVP